MLNRVLDVIMSSSLAMFYLCYWSTSGEILSLLLFSEFIDDLEFKLQENLTSGIDVNNIMLLLLLFADHMVLMSKSATL